MSWLDREYFSIFIRRITVSQWAGLPFSSVGQTDYGNRADYGRSMVQHEDTVSGSVGQIRNTVGGSAGQTHSRRWRWPWLPRSACALTPPT